MIFLFDFCSDLASGWAFRWAGQMVEMYSCKLLWTASLVLMAAILVFPGEYWLFHMVPSSSSVFSPSSFFKGPGIKSRAVYLPWYGFTASTTSLFLLLHLFYWVYFNTPRILTLKCLRKNCVSGQSGLCRKILFQSQNKQMMNSYALYCLEFDSGDIYVHLTFPSLQK